MIYSIKGKISFDQDNIVIVDTGSMAFECVCSANTIYKLTANNADEQTILTYLQVREDGMSLFGFYDNDEKKLFLNLISVSGIGPKMATQILSHGSVGAIIEAISAGDTRLLSSIKGLGKKTAERICLELKDKVDALSGENNLISGLGLSKGRTQAIDDAIEVLISLGISKTEAKELAETFTDASMTAEEAVKACLKGMRR